jgi:hypothetical protein
MKFGETVGHFLNVPEEEYHALKIPSNSSVKLYNRLPALYEVEYLNRGQDNPFAHFQQGKAFELLILEPEKASMIKSFAGKSYDSNGFFDAAEANPGSIILSEKDLTDVARWVACWERLDKQYDRTAENVAQVSCIVEVPTIDIPVRYKMRADDVDFDNRVIYDYKLVKSAHPSDFSRAIWEYGYDIQAAMYLKGMSMLFPEGDPWRFVFNVQEKHHYGYDSRFSVQYDLDSTSLEGAWDRAFVALQLIAESERDKRFSGYHSTQLNLEKYRKWEK